MLFLSDVFPSIASHEGYFVDRSDWQPELALKIAEANHLNLTESHWAVIKAAQAYHERTGLSPAMRPLVSALKVLDENANSMTLKSLFPNDTAQMISLLAGLPKPTRCL